MSSGFTPLQTDASLSVEAIMQHFERRNYHVIRTESCWWYNEYHQTRFYSAFPLHRKITPSNDELSKVFRAEPKAFALRFLSAQETKEPSFIWARHKPYDLQALSANSRSKVRRGLGRCKIREVTFREIIEMGWTAHQDTLRRHGETANTLGLDESLSECSAYQAWGAFVDNDLAAFLVTLRVEDWVYLLVNRSMDAHLKEYPNNALVYTVVETYLACSDITTVSYGLEPLSVLKTLDQFKESMGFERERIHQRVVLRSWLRPLLNPAIRQLILRTATLRPFDVRLQKLAGLTRFITN
jgi:hypothetical protein